jgi:hypothetical protein
MFQTIDPNWQSITNVYSPPIGHYVYHLPLYDFEIQNIGLIIGKNGIHFKNMTLLFGLSYLWFNSETKSIEIWGSTEKNVIRALSFLLKKMISK